MIIYKYINDYMLALLVNPLADILSSADHKFGQITSNQSLCLEILMRLSLALA